MKISLKQLQVFVFTAKSGSLSQAAEQCFITQPAASMALQQLEALLGSPLFDRVGRRLRLNSTGQMLLVKANNILDEVTEFEAFGRQNLSGKLRIAATLTIGNYLLPDYLVDFKREHPGVELSLTMDNTRSITAQLKALELDFALLEAYDAHEHELEFTPWLSDDLVIVSKLGHPAAGQSINFAKLEQYPWVLREIGSGTQALFSDYARDKLVIDTQIRLETFEAIKQYVAKSECLSCLSKQAIKDNQDLAVLRVADFNLSRTLYIVSAKQKYQTALSQTFQEYLLQKANTKE